MNVFTTEDMEDLLRIYAAVGKLSAVMELLIGKDFAPMYENGIYGQLQLVNEIIRRHSELYDPDANYEDQEYSKILDDEEVDIEQKARILMGA